MSEYSFIRFERSGGLMGLTIVLDQASLDDMLEEQIRCMMVESGLMAMPPDRGPEKPMPDEFTYTLIFIAGEVEQIRIFQESQIPESLRPLIRFLSQKAGHATRR